MAEDGAEDLSAGFARLTVEEHSTKALGAENSLVPVVAVEEARSSSSAKETEDTSTVGGGNTKSRTRDRRVDSHSESESSMISTTTTRVPKLSDRRVLSPPYQKDSYQDAAHIYEKRLEDETKMHKKLRQELSEMQAELEEVKRENLRLICERENEQLRALKKQKEYELEIEFQCDLNMTWQEKIQDLQSQSIEEQERLERVIEQLQERDSIQQMKLDGRYSTYKDEIRIERKRFDGEFSEIICSRIFRFPKWENSVIYGPNSEDRSAIAFVRLFGHLYGAKAGKNRGDLGDFIESNHWTNEAMLLSRKIDMPLNRSYATHAETQLIAFYITRLMEASGFKMNDIDNPEAHDACRRFSGSVTIHVSQEVCKSCKDFVEKINDITSSFGLKFNPEDKLRPYRPERVSDTSEGIDVTIVDQLQAHLTNLMF